MVKQQKIIIVRGIVVAKRIEIDRTHTQNYRIVIISPQRSFLVSIARNRRQISLPNYIQQIEKKKRGGGHTEQCTFRYTKGQEDHD